MAGSPTQRTLAHLRSLGCLADVTEHWLPWAKRRKDLFGIVDVLALGPDGSTIAVQTTSGSNVSKRVDKIAGAPATPYMRKAGWRILVHGWRKNAKGRWVLREVDVS